jgi:hypothetical protein
MEREEKISHMGLFMGTSRFSLFLYSYGKTMQLRFFLFALLIFGCKLSASPVERIIEAIESQDASKVIAVFDSMESMTIKEARHFINELYDHYHKVSPCEPQKSRRSFFSSLPLFACDCRWVRNLGLLVPRVPSIQNLLAPHLAMLPLSMHMQIHRITSVFLACSDIEDENLPADFVLGGVEIFVGTLMCILPFPPARWLGGIIIADGINRTFNGVKELDEQNRADIFGEE